MENVYIGTVVVRDIHIEENVPTSDLVFIIAWCISQKESSSNGKIHSNLENGKISTQQKGKQIFLKILDMHSKEKHTII